MELLLESFRIPYSLAETAMSKAVECSFSNAPNLKEWLFCVLLVGFMGYGLPCFTMNIEKDCNHKVLRYLKLVH
jgi:hypothetical protein